MYLVDVSVICDLCLLLGLSQLITKWGRGRSTDRTTSQHDGKSPTARASAAWETQKRKSFCVEWRGDTGALAQRKDLEERVTAVPIVRIPKKEGPYEYSSLVVGTSQLIQ